MDKVTKNRHIPVILACNLTNDFFGTERRDRQNLVNIGVTENERLFGKVLGRNGPLKSLITEANRVGDIKIIYTRVNRLLSSPGHIERIAKQENERYGNFGLDKRGLDFVDPLVSENQGGESGIGKIVVKKDSLLESSSMFSLPLKELHRQLLGYQGGIGDELDPERFKILIAGAPTETYVLHFAITIRNTLGIDVATSPDIVGSRNLPSHNIALRRDFLDAGVDVAPGLSDAVVHFLGNALQRRVYEVLRFSGCGIRFNCKSGEENDFLLGDNKMSEEEKASARQHRMKILELACIGNHTAEIEKITGGKSGSTLLNVLVDLEKGKGHPFIIKIDKADTIQREVRGYEMVKPYLGRHASLTDGKPIQSGSHMGLKIDIASMSGEPISLKKIYKDAQNRQNYSEFDKILKGALSILINKLYLPTSSRKSMHLVKGNKLSEPYTTDRLLKGLSNKEKLASGDYVEGENKGDFRHCKVIYDIFRGNSRNLNGLGLRLIQLFEREVVVPGIECITHRDLNLGNIITDGNKNYCFIDWPKAQSHFIETDFCKLENDFKFSIRWHGREKFENLVKFETYILGKFQLPDIHDISDNEVKAIVLRYSTFSAMYNHIKLVRDNLVAIPAYKDLIKDNKLPASYLASLLRYAINALSYDHESRGGEPMTEQMYYAIISMALIEEKLKNSGIYNKNSGFYVGYPEPCSYIPISWSEVDESYSPPDYSSAEARSRGDPDIEDIKRPLNPTGPKGIKGRGEFFYWGENVAMDPVVTRFNDKGDLEVLLVKRLPSNKDSYSYLALPCGLIKGNNDYIQSMMVSFEEKTGHTFSTDLVQRIGDFGSEDIRNTDNAWIKSIVCSIHFNDDSQLKKIETSQKANYKWVNVSEIDDNDIFSNQYDFIVEGVRYLLNKRNAELDETKTQYLNRLLEKLESAK